MREVVLNNNYLNNLLDNIVKNKFSLLYALFRPRTAFDLFPYLLVFYVIILLKI